jgi:hypothetical protein
MNMIQFSVISAMSYNLNAQYPALKQGGYQALPLGTVGVGKTVTLRHTCTMHSKSTYS